MNKIFVLFLLFVSFLSNGQIGVGAKAPKKAKILFFDIKKMRNISLRRYNMKE
jgi:hypothetical protein